MRIEVEHLGVDDVLAFFEGFICVSYLAKVPSAL